MIQKKLKKEQELRVRSSMSASELGALKLVERTLSPKQWHGSKSIAGGL